MLHGGALSPETTLLTLLSTLASTTNQQDLSKH